MDYHFAKKVDYTFQEAHEKTLAALKEGGFGIISEIDLREKFRKSLGIAFRNYKILVAFNPRLVLPAIEQDDKIGIMLSCNVLVQEHVNGKVEVTAVSLLELGSGIDNAHLQSTARDISLRLQSVFESI